MRRVSTHPDHTFELGLAVGRAAFPGTVVALIGDLGAGKTVFAQGVGAGLGVEGPVQSPTFILVQEHEGRLALFHADVYRVESAAELAQTGLEEMIEADGVTLVEWADSHPQLLPPDHLEVRIRHLPEAREIQLTAHGPRHAALLEQLRG